ncbi:MAG: RNA pseudouridine synthase [Puniceicoccales bacterium]|nr:RNA pseudouridine synthase [Puniceicoccales bacterium]
MDLVPWHPNVRVLRSSNGILAINKPSGLISHPNKENCKVANSLILAPYDLQREAYIIKNEFVYLLNRLDSPTSGIVLLTMHTSVAHKVREAFRYGRIKKMYQALVKGRVPQSTLWKDVLRTVKNEKQQLRSRCQHGGVDAQTEVHVERYGQLKEHAYTQLMLCPQTGRTHQLRVQCASRNFPILGDRTYGDFAFNRLLHLKRLYLHAHFTAFDIDSIHFEAKADCPWSDDVQTITIA